MLDAGSTCPKCNNGRMRTRSSCQAGEHHQVRYLECCACGNRAKTVVPADRVWRRSLVPYKQVQ